MRQLFVFGVARSGTNLITGALNAHTKISLALDPLMPLFKSLRYAIGLASGSDNAIRLDFFKIHSAFVDGYFREESLAVIDAVLSGNLDHLVPGNPRKLVESISQRTALESPQLAEKLRLLCADNFHDLLEDIIDIVAENSGKDVSYSGCKEVWTVDFIPLLARAFPHAKFIVNRRDPRAIIASLIALGQRDPSQIAHKTSYMRHWRKEATLVHEMEGIHELQNRLLVTRYEDIAANPRNEFLRICDFLEIQPEASMHKPQLGADSWGDANSSFEEIKGISGKSINRWKKFLQEDMIRCIEYHCGPEMIEAGYALHSELPIELDCNIRHVVHAVDRELVSWRSDSGCTEENLAYEQQRWSMLYRRCEDRFLESEIRLHFLSKSYYQLLFSRIKNHMNSSLNEDRNEDV